MTPKELYELAAAVGAEDYEIESWLETEELIALLHLKLDYISHSNRVVVLTNKYKPITA